MAPRIKRQLRSKELTVTGSHWPIFIYRDERYDPENPWKGLFRNEMLVKVRITAPNPRNQKGSWYTRPSSISSLALALLMMNPKRRVPEMLDCTV
jgi:hypothetical protein